MSHHIHILLFSLLLLTGCQSWSPSKIQDNISIVWRYDAPDSLKRIKTVYELREAYKQGRIPDYYDESCIFWLNSLQGMQVLLEEGAPTGQGCLEDIIDFQPRPDSFDGTIEDAYALFIHYGLSPTAGSKHRLPPVFSMRYNVVKWALQNGADANTIYLNGWRTFTPLNHLHKPYYYIEGKTSRREIARLLLSHGADVNLSTDSIPEKPISLASREEFNSQYERKQWINLYLKYGAKKADIRPQIKRDVESIYFKSSP